MFRPDVGLHKEAEDKSRFLWRWKRDYQLVENFTTMELFFYPRRDSLLLQLLRESRVGVLALGVA